MESKSEVVPGKQAGQCWEGKDARVRLAHDTAGAFSGTLGLLWFSVFCSAIWRSLIEGNQYTNRNLLPWHANRIPAAHNFFLCEMVTLSS